jgi:hypothetical protein
MKSNAVSDIRASSYDAATANAVGYHGTIDEALAQIRAEPDVKPFPISARTELLMFLGVYKIPSKVSVPEDDSVEYGVPGEPSPYSLDYAMARWPQNFQVRS